MNNTDPLQHLTPELVERFEKEMHAATQHRVNAMTLQNDLWKHRHLIIAAMRAALRWKREMDSTQREAV